MFLGDMLCLTHKISDRLAFGVFRTTFIRTLGGWDSGAAENLNMTMRIKQYFGRHPALRIVFDPHALGHIDVPRSFKEFFAQRLRWDGDQFYIFVRKFRHSFQSRLLGWRTFLFTVLTGLLLQLVMPFVIVLYTLMLFSALPIASALQHQVLSLPISPVHTEAEVDTVVAALTDIVGRRS